MLTVQQRSRKLFDIPPFWNWRGAAEIVCRIPAGLGLFINIISVEASQAESPGSTIENLHEIAKNDQDHVTSTYLKINYIRNNLFTKI